MAGRATPVSPSAVFYSGLFELGLRTVGDVDVRLETVADWEREVPQRVWFYYLKDGRVRACSCGTPGQVDHARALIAEPRPFKSQI